MSLTAINPTTDNMTPTEHLCSCGNHFTIQPIAIELGLVDSCGHCHQPYPREQHEEVMQQYVVELGDDLLMDDFDDVIDFI